MSVAWGTGTHYLLDQQPIQVEQSQYYFSWNLMKQQLLRGLWTGSASESISTTASEENFYHKHLHPQAAHWQLVSIGFRRWKANYREKQISLFASLDRNSELTPGEQCCSQSLNDRRIQLLPNHFRELHPRMEQVKKNSSYRIWRLRCFDELPTTQKESQCSWKRGRKLSWDLIRSGLKGEERARMGPGKRKSVSLLIEKCRNFTHLPLLLCGIINMNVESLLRVVTDV